MGEKKEEGTLRRKKKEVKTEKLICSFVELCNRSLKVRT
jgi:hypothetical protein